MYSQKIGIQKPGTGPMAPDMNISRWFISGHEEVRKMISWFLLGYY